MSPSAERTDWDAYYAQPARLAGITRGFTTRHLLRCLRLYEGDLREARLLELGGGNSCFFDAVVRAVRPAGYEVLDSNGTGLELFRERTREDPRVRVHEGDVLTLSSWESPVDVCFSVGLIEHFDEPGTRAAIETHFRCTRPGGLVILFFPTPTALYRAARGVVEALGAWPFPDERPLGFDEVLRTAAPHGRIRYRGINWGAFFTQGMLAVRVEG